MRLNTASKLPFLTIGMVMVINFISYLDRVCMSVAGPGIRKEFSLTVTQLGWVFGAFSFSYALLQAPWGALADRFGGQRVIGPAILGWSVFTAVTAAGYSFPSLVAIRLAFGAVEAGLAPAVAALVHELVPAQLRSTAFGLFLGSGRLGGAFAPGITATIALRAGWRVPFLLFAGLGVAAACAWKLSVHAHPQPSPSRRPAISCADPAGLVTVSVAALLLSAFAYTLAWQFYATWFPTFLMERFGYSLTQAGGLAGLPFLCGIAGNWLGGYGVDRAAKALGVGRGRTLSGTAALLLSAMALVLGSHDSSPVRSTLELSAAAGLGDAFLSAAWSSAVDLGGSSAATLSGLMNTASNFGAMASPVILGWARQQSNGWFVPLAIAAGSIFLAAAIWPFVNSLQQRPNPSIPLGPDLN